MLRKVEYRSNYKTYLLVNTFFKLYNAEELRANDNYLLTTDNLYKDHSATINEERTYPAILYKTKNNGAKVITEYSILSTKKYLVGTLLENNTWMWVFTYLTEDEFNDLKSKWFKLPEQAKLL